MPETNIPFDWACTQGWTRSFSPTSKRPLIAPDEEHHKFTTDLPTLMASDSPTTPLGLYGFITSNSNPFCIIDIDTSKEVKDYLKSQLQISSPFSEEYLMVFQDQVISKLPTPIQKLITTTYTEFSTSNTGLHVIIKTDKSGLTKSYYKSKDFDGQLSIKNNYMVTTGRKLPNSSNTISEVPVELLSILFGITTQSSQQYKTDLRDTKAISSAQVVPSIQEIEQALFLIPIDQSPRIKEVYYQITNTKYEHYHFWITIGMALHDYAVKTNNLPNGLAMYIKWSVQDKVAFVSDQDVAKKWESFSSAPENNITFNTLFKIALEFQFNYPRRAKPNSLVPDKAEYCNFSYLINKYHLKLYSANGIEVYLTGDHDIIEKYFLLNDVHNMFGYYGPFTPVKLQVATWRLCQDSLWKGLTSTANFVQAWLEEPRPNIDVFTLWLDTPNDKLSLEYKYPRYFADRPRRLNQDSSKNTWEYFSSLIKWSKNQDVELCKTMLYKTLMLLIKLHDPVAQTFEDNGGMFAILGEENTYKTTFFKLLLPQPLEFLRKDINQELDSEKAKRDFIRYLSTRAIVLVDEFEGFMNHKKSGSFFKSIITGNTTSFTDIYQTNETALKRKAILVGTSNELEQIISQNGSRRLWYGKIDYIDTSAMLDIDLHQLYNNLRKEFHEALARGESPWTMTKHQTQLVTINNRDLALESSIDIVLREEFPYSTNIHALEAIQHFSISALDKRFMKTTQIATLLKYKGVTNFTMAELKRSLQRFCTAFLGAQTFVMQKKSLAFEHGQLCAVKRPDGYWNHKFWVMPIAEDCDE